MFLKKNTEEIDALNQQISQLEKEKEIYKGKWLLEKEENIKLNNKISKLIEKIDIEHIPDLYQSSQEKEKFLNIKKELHKEITAIEKYFLLQEDVNFIEKIYQGLHSAVDDIQRGKVLKKLLKDFLTTKNHQSTLFNLLNKFDLSKSLIPYINEIKIILDDFQKKNPISDEVIHKHFKQFAITFEALSDDEKKE